MTRTSRPLTIIESPYAGNIALHVAYARLCLYDSLRRGEAPFASHLLYTQVLHDHEPDERFIGLECNRAFHQRASLIAFYEDFGMSPGMVQAHKWAREDSSEIVFRRLPADVVANLLSAHNAPLSAWVPPSPTGAPHNTDEK